MQKKKNLKTKNQKQMLNIKNQNLKIKNQKPKSKNQKLMETIINSVLIKKKKYLMVVGFPEFFFCIR